MRGSKSFGVGLALAVLVAALKSQLVWPLSNCDPGSGLGRANFARSVLTHLSSHQVTVDVSLAQPCQPPSHQEDERVQSGPHPFAGVPREQRRAAVVVAFLRGSADEVAVS